MKGMSIEGERRKVLVTVDMDSGKLRRRGLLCDLDQLRNVVDMKYDEISDFFKKHPIKQAERSISQGKPTIFRISSLMGQP